MEAAAHAQGALDSSVSKRRPPPCPAPVGGVAVEEADPFEALDARQHPPSPPTGVTKKKYLTGILTAKQKQSPPPAPIGGVAVEEADPLDALDARQRPQQLRQAAPAAGAAAAALAVAAVLGRVL